MGVPNLIDQYIQQKEYILAAKLLKTTCILDILC